MKQFEALFSAKVTPEILLLVSALESAGFLNIMEQVWGAVRSAHPEMTHKEMVDGFAGPIRKAIERHAMGNDCLGKMKLSKRWRNRYKQMMPEAQRVLIAKFLKSKDAFVRGSRN